MHNVVLIPGDGIGIEISEAVQRILNAAGAPIEWVPAKAGMSAYDELGTPLPDETLDLIEQHRLVLKGPLATPVGSGFRSVNVAIRQKFNLYSNIRPAKTLPGIQTPFKDVDLVLFRENTQGMYIGQERWVGDDEKHAESIAVITRKASEKIIHAAFQYAVKHDRKKVALVHKANILKFTTGLFLQIGQEIAGQYPEIEFRDLIVDNMAMQMVMNPHQFEVIVTTNLFGDILSDLASGLVGGLGLTGSANLGDDCAMFEAVHGSAPDIAGQKKANPTALLFSALMLLDHLGHPDLAKRIHAAVCATLINKEVCTPNVGGSGDTFTYADAICIALK